MAVEDAPSYAELTREVERLTRELAEALGFEAEAREREAAASAREAEARADLSEALERQTATAEILRVISRSPTDLQRVLDALVESAARVCGATDAIIQRVEGGERVIAAKYGTLATFPVGTPTGAVTRGSVTGRAIIERRTVHVHDLLAESEQEYPDGRAMALRLGHRTTLATPLIHESEVMGAILIRRVEVQPFTDDQIALLETFADQAVIAIENARLFRELENRNRDITEALEQQTATSEVLKVIATSPTELQPVLDTLLENAVRLCGADRGLIFRAETGLFHLAASRNVSAEFLDIYARNPAPVGPGTVTGRATLERRTIQVEDVLADPEYAYPAGPVADRYRTVLAIPMLRQDQVLGVFCVTRSRAEVFGPRQVELVETFADQAVIAIENVRLFTELEARTRELARSVEELRALGEVGQAVSSSLDLGRVLDTVVSHADELSGTDGGVLYEYDAAAEAFRLRATHRLGADMTEAVRATPIRLGEGAIGRAALEREPVQVPDITAEGAYRGRLLEMMVASGYRAVLAVPLIGEGQIFGGLVVARKTPGEFPPNVVELARTFASQSALAIQNARLYRELENKSKQLEVVSRHKSEFLANMSHELRTPLNAIIGFSEVLLERMFGDLNDKQDEYLGDILTSGRHLLSLINDILDLSKVEAGRMELELGQFSLREALANGLTMLKERASRHGIMLGLEVEDGLDVVEADERKVKQVVFNLLSNAVKFTPDGGRVEVSARRVAGGVEVAVRDTGVGIAPDDLPRVFDEFRQVGQSETRHEGTGLGLALAKKFVELHGGRIRAESEVGVGSTFAFTVPWTAGVRSLRSRAPE